MKPCPFCAEEIQDAAIKCRHCGSMLDGAAPEVGRAPAPRAAPALVTLFAGTPSWRAQFGAVFWATALCVAGVALVPVLSQILGQSVDAALVAGGVAFALGVLWLLWLWLARISLRFTITTRAIDVETGLISKRIETVQLWKVRDVEFRQSVFDRLLGVSRIRVFAQDVTTPQFLLWGLPASRDVFERLKEAVEISRQSRNVIGVVE